MAEPHQEAVIRVPLSGALAWVLPGLGHYYLGERKRAIILFVTITATFWSGVALGGVKRTIDPSYRKLWFIAQLCTGVEALAGYAWHARVEPTSTLIDPATRKQREVPPFGGYWSSIEIGIHYTGVAGLLNLLAILDAMMRAEAHDPRRRLTPALSRDGP